MDPLEMSYGRYRNLVELIPGVNGEFTPKTPIQVALETREQEIKNGNKSGGS